MNGEEQQKRLGSIDEEIRVCERCALAATRAHAVPGEGDSRAVVMFVGEGPGHDEDQQGRPFVGRSGQLLTQVMQKAGIRREDVFITNVVKCRPPDNRDPLNQELEACSDYLERQIDVINPRIIVTLGRFSMRRWFPSSGITRLHGQIRNIGRGRVALAMFHPAAALRNPQWQNAFVQDMAKLPPLIERAKTANELAEQGEGLAAGVPHPGDPDYVESAATEPEIEIEKETKTDDHGDVTAHKAAAQRPDLIEDLDDAEQLSLW